MVYPCWLTAIFSIYDPTFHHLLVAVDHDVPVELKVIY
jgi:hypothetical protein